mmetsp:Transcript_66546/g.216554  ORF Transcript_66546/g.216554 Transcript_66546/m.216554 type:complete len:209 (-) Transcript_66546:199-825(-)
MRWHHVSDRQLPPLLGPAPWLQGPLWSCCHCGGCRTKGPLPAPEGPAPWLQGPLWSRCLCGGCRTKGPLPAPEGPAPWLQGPLWSCCHCGGCPAKGPLPAPGCVSCSSSSSWTRNPRPFRGTMAISSAPAADADATSIAARTLWRCMRLDSSSSGFAASNSCFSNSSRAPLATGASAEEATRTPTSQSRGVRIHQSAPRKCPVCHQTS